MKEVAGVRSQVSGFCSRRRCEPPLGCLIVDLAVVGSSLYPKT